MAKVGDGRGAAAHAPNTNAETDNRNTCRGTKGRDDVVRSMTRCRPGQRQCYRGLRQGWTALYRRHVPDQQQDSQACGHPANGGGAPFHARTHALPTAAKLAPEETAHRAPSTTWQVILSPLMGGGRSARRSHRVCIARERKSRKCRGAGVATACSTATTADPAKKGQAYGQPISYTDGVEP